MISENCKIYLENYYVLEQTRDDLHRYLEHQAIELANEFAVYLKTVDNQKIEFKRFVQREGGYLEFTFDRKYPLEGIPSIDRWKFSIVYRDAMRADNISSSVKCKIYCFSPKSYGKQNYEIKRMNTKLNLPDLYREKEVNLLSEDPRAVVAEMKHQMIELYEQFMQIVTALEFEENEN